jgi:hypothetical protein
MKCNELGMRNEALEKHSAIDAATGCRRCAAVGTNKHDAVGKISKERNGGNF